MFECFSNQFFMRTTARRFSGIFRRSDCDAPSPFGPAADRFAVRGLCTGGPPRPMQLLLGDEEEVVEDVDDSLAFAAPADDEDAAENKHVVPYEAESELEGETDASEQLVEELLAEKNTDMGGSSRVELVEYLERSAR